MTEQMEKYGERCDHGNIRRSCLTCELQEDLNTAYADIENLRIAVAQVKAFYLDEKQRAEKAEAENVELKLTSICVYCKTVLTSKTPEDKMEDMIQHMAECKVHPVPILLEQVEELRARLAGIEEVGKLKLCAFPHMLQFEELCRQYKIMFKAICEAVEREE